MFKHSLVTLYGLCYVSTTSAAGCFPPWTPGKAYNSGDAVSSDGTNYICVDNAYSVLCGSYQPGTHSGTTAWIPKEACSGVAGPASDPNHTVRPTLAKWSNDGCPPQFSPAFAYGEGEFVEADGIVYECKTGAASALCGMSTFEPGEGLYWPSAWNQMGSCSGTISPTASPIFPLGAPGCPEKYVSGKVYGAGDSVTVGNVVYECKEWPSSLFCPQDGFAPGPDGWYWKSAWIKKGGCVGTITPTKAPVRSPATKFGGCPEAWSESAMYEGGDRVTKDSVVYECKSGMSSGWCSIAAYEPGSDGAHGDAWQEAWKELGWCEGTVTPTTSPIISAAFLGGCPHSYVETKSYKANDEVEKNGVVYRCKADVHVSKWCASSTFAPGGTYGFIAWNKIGSCSGTKTPTSSPIVSRDPSELFPSASPSKPKPQIESIVEGVITLSGVSCPTTDDETQALVDSLDATIVAKVEEKLGAGERVNDNVVVTSCTSLRNLRRLAASINAKYTLHFERLCEGSCDADDETKTGNMISVAMNDLKASIEDGSFAENVAALVKEKEAGNLISDSFSATDGGASEPVLLKLTGSPTVSPSNFGTADVGASNIQFLQLTGRPSGSPSSKPSATPSLHALSSKPSSEPSSGPSLKPSSAPSFEPSSDPSSQPSSKPSHSPSFHPSLVSSSKPSLRPSSTPSFEPSSDPSSQPSSKPSSIPSFHPSLVPSSKPSSAPSFEPSSDPSSQPSSKPSSIPSFHPSLVPSSKPSLRPSSAPSFEPSSAPSSQPSGFPIAEVPFDSGFDDELDCCSPPFPFRF